MFETCLREDVYRVLHLSIIFFEELPVLFVCEDSSHLFVCKKRNVCYNVCNNPIVSGARAAR